MHDKKPCRIEILARTERCTVGYCRACNLFHVDLGHATLRMRVLDMHLVTAALVDALEAFKTCLVVGDVLPAAMPAVKEPVH